MIILVQLIKNFKNCILAAQSIFLHSLHLSFNSLFLSSMPVIDKTISGIFKMSNKERDNNLLIKIKNNDDSAFKQLFEIYYENLCRTAYKVYQDENKAKDFVQEVFLDLWKRRGSIQIRSSVSGYLKRATINKSIDHIRAQKVYFGEQKTPKKSTSQPDSKLEFTELKEFIHQRMDVKWAYKE